MAEPGRMIELRAAGVRAVVDADRGGRLASLRLGPRELLLGPPDATDASILWGSFLMAPWPGRLAGGRVRWRGRSYQLERTHGRHAIHGLVWAAPWRVGSVTGSRAELAADLARGGWPFGGEVRQSYELDRDGLTMRAEVLASQAMPAALGWHPWFQRHADGEPAVRLDAGAVLERRDMLPTGRALPLAGRFDLRAGPRLGPRRLDDTYARVRAPAVLRWPDLELRLEFDPACSFAVVYSPPHALCVEPMTAGPNALGTPGVAGIRLGRRDLEPGESLVATLRLGWR